MQGHIYSFHFGAHFFWVLGFLVAFLIVYAFGILKVRISDPVKISNQNYMLGYNVTVNLFEIWSAISRETSVYQHL